MNKSYQSLTCIASEDKNYLEPLLEKHAPAKALQIQNRLDFLYKQYSWAWIAADAVDHPASKHASLTEVAKMALREIRYAILDEAKAKYISEVQKELERRSKDGVGKQIAGEVIAFARTPLPIEAHKVDDQLIIKTAQQHFHKVHHDQSGLVVLWHAKDVASRWKKVKPSYALISNLLDEQNERQDRYMSVSEFTSWKIVSNLHRLRALFVDIDGCVDLDYCLQEVANCGLPQPTFAMLTGRGIHLYWLINPCDVTQLALWQRLQVHIGKTLHSAGVPVDLMVRDCTRVLRIAGSINSKNCHRVSGKVISDVTYELKELADSIFGTTIKRDEDDRYKKALDADTRRDAQIRDFRAAQVRNGIQPRRAPSNSAQGGIYGWWQLVYRDLITIGDQLGGIPKGHRDIYLFLYCVALSWFADVDALETEAFLVAKKMMPEFKSSEIKKAIAPNIKRAVAAQSGKTVTWQGKERDPRYWYKRETMMDLLSSVIQTDMYPSLRALVPSDIRKERRATSDKLRDRSERYLDANTKANVRVSNLAKAAEAQALRKTGKTYQEIANELGVAFNSVYRWCNSTK